MNDVIIIGGGPVGLHAARCLARDGFEVDVLEEHWSAGEPVHCTGILAPEVFREFSVPADVTLNELRKVRFHSPRGSVVHFETETVEAVMVDRRSFDGNLKTMACDCGARMHHGSRAVKIEIRTNGAFVRCADGSEYRARACILATGSAYALHRDLKIGFPPLYLNCAQVELPADSPGDVEIFLGSEIAPKGFAWAAPVQRAEGAFARVGLMCEGDAAGYFAGFLSRLEGWRLHADTSMRPRQRMLPLAPIKKTYGERLLIAGDAAGFVKPTTGGGVFYGMISADIAAKVLAEALRRDRLAETELSIYQHLWKERLMEEIEAQLTLRLLMQRLTDDEVESIFDLWLTDGLMPLIRKTVAFNHHRKLIAAMIRYPAMRKILFRKALF
ncbi:MAG: NAD(P)/FAD-dependent oxidoreductase [Acidobacteria bacterium]|nr:NAD(P)/FAD-dependent oxidoreductase [Acidobacteriota bacterium]